MAHQATGMATMEPPTQAFGQHIDGVDGARDVVHDDVILIFPIQNGKKVNVDMARALGRFSGVNHLDGRFVVLIDGSGGQLNIAKFSKDGPEILCNLGSRDITKNSPSVELRAVKGCK